MLPHSFVAAIRAACLATVVLAAAACTGDAVGDDERSDGSTVEPGPDGGGLDLAGLPHVDISLRPGPQRVIVDAVGPTVSPGQEIQAISGGRAVGRAVVAENGTALLRGVPAGPATIVVADATGPIAVGPEVQIQPLDLVAAAPPDPGRYGATNLEQGFSYIETRDGTMLSAMVTLPGPVDQGPYPTLIEYSGYSPSRPGGLDPSRLVFPALGFALVQVNLRGTGCSGGSFDAFEPIAALDGYDVVETVAAQPWSARVGMWGVSYAAIMQLHVAATRPPSLTAIAPLSPLADIGDVLNPGGIANIGFAATWTSTVSDGARAFGQSWTQERADGGDETCATNQALRVHNPDLVSMIQQSPFTDDFTIERSPITAASRISVPIFIGGAWQDEQTGAGWPALLDEFDSAPIVRGTLYNGLHVDSLSPELVADVTEFYDIYLENPDPGAGLLVSAGLSGGLTSVYGAALPIPFRSFDPERRAEVRQAYEASAPIRVLFEQGASRPNLPVPGFEARFTSWPPPTVTATPLAFAAGPEGDGLQLVLADGASPPAAPAASATFVTDPAEATVNTASDGERIWTNDPGWAWPRPTAGGAVVVTSAPLTDDLVLAGPSSVDLWVSVDGVDADVEVTLSEVHPDGAEVYVQSGWLRLSGRALSPSSDTLRPIRTGREADVAPLTPGEPVAARVALAPVAHPVRAGSRLRLTIDSPGASQPLWRFAAGPAPVSVTVLAGGDHPSQLVLPVVGGMAAPTARPPCGVLRGQPCR